MEPILNQYPEINTRGKRKMGVRADSYDPTNQNNEKQKQAVHRNPIYFSKPSLMRAFTCLITVTRTSPYSKFLTKFFILFLLCVWPLHPAELQALLAGLTDRRGLLGWMGFLRKEEEQ